MVLVGIVKSSGQLPVGLIWFCMYQEKGEGCGLFGEPKNLRDRKFTASGAHQSADLSASGTGHWDP